METVDIAQEQTETLEMIDIILEPITMETVDTALGTMVIQIGQDQVIIGDIIL